MTSPFRKLQLPPDGRRTPEGEPWVSWSNVPSSSGWIAAGARAPGTLGGASHFWRTVVAAVSTLHGGGLDQAFTGPEVVLAGGALGSTLVSGALQDLLHECLLLEPARTVEVLAPLYHATGIYTYRGRQRTELRRGPRTPVTRVEALTEAVTLRDTYGCWSQAGKDRARLWVSTVSRLLRDERMDPAQLRHAERWLPALMLPSVALAVRWTADSTEASWQYTQEQQYLWAVALTLSAQSPALTEGIFAPLPADEPFDAVAMVERLHASLRAQALTGDRAPFERAFEVLRAAFSIGEKS